MSHSFEPAGPGRQHELPRPRDEGLGSFWAGEDLIYAAPVLPLDGAQRAALGRAVDAGLRERGCNHTLATAQRWAVEAGVGWPGLRAQLEGNGGYCDCEVLLNVLVDDAYEPD